MSKSKSLPTVVAKLRPLAACVAIAVAGAASPPAWAAPVALGHLLDLPRNAHPRPATANARANPQIRAPANTIVITSCADDGSPGTLRFAVETAAVSGDTIDASQLSCSTITLQSGAIAVAEDSLTINGPANGQLEVTANLQSRVFTHTGSGALTLQNLYLFEGKIDTTGVAEGGCIYSLGAVALIDTKVKYCRAYSSSDVAFGGAIYAAGSVGLNGSTIAVATANGSQAAGGAIFTRDFTAKYSEVASSTAISTDFPSSAGGVLAEGNVLITHSTIFNNTADQVGGLDIGGAYANARSVILNSTISNNTAYDSVFGSGVYVGYATLIANSTISGNIEENPANAKYGAGVFVRGTAALELESSVVSGNELVQPGVSGYQSSDLGSNVDGVVVTGANNLINIVTHDVSVPADTLRMLPDLGPLQPNGGLTPTQVPNAGSPLIGRGNTVASPGSCDQRGAGYPRTTDGRIDIGAVQAPASADTIFGDGFDGLSACPG
jgi:hypothetical protein